MLRTEVIKRTEKIASAIYLITGFFSDIEPLKWRLRTLSADLISKSHFIKDNLEDIFGPNDEFKKVVREIRSLTNVAKTSGLISEVNYGIFIRELNRVDVQDIDEAEAMNKLISSRFFEVMPKVLPEKKEIALKDNIESVQKMHINKDKKTSKEDGAVALKKTNRQNIIISILKKKKEIMIKDVSPLIDGVSEKTIQRELLTMVKQGVLRKFGEKRWSRYSLA